MFVLARLVGSQVRGVGIQQGVVVAPALVHHRHFSTSPTTNSEKPCSLIGQNFLTLKHFSPDEIQTLLWTANDSKTRIKGGEIYHPLVAKSITLIFQKWSTRTRMSSEMGMSLLGGKACFLSPADIHIGVNESIKDSARVLSGFVDLILGRVFGQEDLNMLADEASVPIISGLSDTYHPLQILADFQTLQNFGSLRGLKVAWVGDGNNIVHSFMMGCPKLGMHLRIATPPGYECFPNVIQDAMEYSERYGTEMNFTTNPLEAVKGADVVVTDTWVSMGQEEEKKDRLEAFQGYQVMRKMCENVASNWVFLHCLPRKPEEVDDDIFYDKKRSIVWQEAENRKWTVMSVMLHLLQDHVPTTPKPNF